MTIYAGVTAEDVIAVQLRVEDPPDGMGPLVPPSIVGAYANVVTLPALIKRPAGLSETALLFLNNGTPEFRETLTLDQARADKTIELSIACGQHIVSGFVCDALGDAHTYPSTVLDQHNLNGLVTRSLYPSNAADWTEKFWCADADGVWARRDHTGAQLRLVGDTAIARITAAQARCDELIAAVMVADAAALSGIVWTAP